MASQQSTATIHRRRVHIPALAILLLILTVGTHSFSISRSQPSSHARDAPFNARISKPVASSSSRTALKYSLLPSCVPNWTYYSIGHILGGCTGTPTVVKATKSWYKRIPLPSWTPPNFVFAPVWTLLYGLMGVSVSRIVNAGVSSNTNALNLWKLHYILNLIWAPLFFGFQYLRVGLVINFGLVTTLLAVLKLFHAIDPVAAYLQIPYLLWLLYATKLNQAICKLNPAKEGLNNARLQADLCFDGEGYNDAMLEYDIAELQAAAAKYAGL